jgi:NADH-quinone oxidoreductase subunit J
MTSQEIVFILLAIATGGSALMVVTSKNLVHAALFLAATLAGIAGVFLVLHADFVALVQLVVYVGAIAVLFLFGLMLTRAPIGREALDSQNRGLGTGVATALFGVLVALIVDAYADFSTTAEQAGREIAGPSTAQLGEAIFSRWVLPFEVASMLLLAALVGAILLSRRDEGDSGEGEFVATTVTLAEPPSAEGELRELPQASGGEA